jgi:hypothetical protein
LEKSTYIAKATSATLLARKWESALLVNVDNDTLRRIKVFNTEQMNQAVFAFRRYEDASLRYTGIESHEGLTHYGLYDTVVARE